jgi:hypothetical protein
VTVHKVTDLTEHGGHVERELALVKVAGTGEHRIEAMRLADIYRARVLDATTSSFVFELTGSSEKVNTFVALMREVGLVEVPAPEWSQSPAAATPSEILEKDNRGMGMKLYYDGDADQDLIKGRKIAIVGYGSQGHAHAQNLRDSGVREVIIALRPGSASARKAEEAGFPVKPVSEAAAWADIVMILAPGRAPGRDLRERDQAARGARRGARLRPRAQHPLRLIEPRPDLDVFMVAPKGPGHTVRSEYAKGGGVPCLFAVAQEARAETATATPRRSRSLMPARSAAAARASSRRASGRNARPTCSASRRCSAAA